MVHDELAIANNGDVFNLHFLSKGNAISFLYLDRYFSYLNNMQVVGPKWMANRKAYDAKGVQFIYNIIHLAINSYIFYQGSTLSYMIGFNFRCQSVDYSTDGIPLKIARICWLYYLSKFTDFFETFIYIALKQFELVNLYHIAHHSIMPVKRRNLIYMSLNKINYIFLFNSFLSGGA